MITLKQLGNTYGGLATRFVEITDRDEALRLLNSKASCCWANGEIKDTGWVQLSRPSPARLGEGLVILVCKKGLVE